MHTGCICMCVLVADLGVVLRQSRDEIGVKLSRRGLVVRKRVGCRGITIGEVEKHRMAGELTLGFTKEKRRRLKRR
ncbi:hypothetical protein DCAR_0522376 [Daucus carota subsp. sativus]|uniref:Uncharacterized protein n=1 Tax=Daucus carota subsp. sativus TaxID=79200 RepID=A0A164ZS05_DAUCS|nr:hypothetical protein DCAR_0522376 [Daucus carota subsp. sativus]